MVNSNVKAHLHFKVDPVLKKEFMSMTEFVILQQENVEKTGILIFKYPSYRSK